MEGWKIKRVLEEARKVGLDDKDVLKLEEEEVNGETLLARISKGTLETVISSEAVKALTSIIKFPAGMLTLHFIQTLIVLLGRRTMKEIEGNTSYLLYSILSFSIRKF